jgi:hypothetical protein
MQADVDPLEFCSEFFQDVSIRFSVFGISENSSPFETFDPVIEPILSLFCDFEIER